MVPVPCWTRGSLPGYSLLVLRLSRVGSKSLAHWFHGVCCSKSGDRPCARLVVIKKANQSKNSLEFFGAHHTPQAKKGLIIRDY